MICSQVTLVFHNESWKDGPVIVDIKESRFQWGLRGSHRGRWTLCLETARTGVVVVASMANIQRSLFESLKLKLFRPDG